jgi:hypothetical protein
LSRASDESDLAHKVRFSIGPHCRRFPFFFDRANIDMVWIQMALFSSHSW